MAFREIYDVVEVVTPFENACAPYKYQWAKQPTLRCSVFGRFRDDGSPIDITVNLASADTSGPVVALQLRHEVDSFRAGAEKLVAVRTEWSRLRPDELRVQEAFYSTITRGQPGICSARVWLDEDHDLSANARVWCPERPRPRIDPIKVQIDIFDHSDRAR